MVMLKASAVPGTTLTTNIFCRGSVTVVPRESPQVVGLPTELVGPTGKFVGQTRVTGPLKVASGTICNWYVTKLP